MSRLNSAATGGRSIFLTVCFFSTPTSTVDDSVRVCDSWTDNSSSKSIHLATFASGMMVYLSVRFTVKTRPCYYEPVLKCCRYGVGIG